MSGVRVLTTCAPPSAPPEMMSSGVRRPPSSTSGEPNWTPLMVTLFRVGLMPRIWTYRPSPFSTSMETPGNRFSASPRLLSGSRPSSSTPRASMVCWASRFSSIALSRARSVPVTMTSSRVAASSWPCAAGVCNGASCAAAAPVTTRTAVLPSKTARLSRLSFDHMMSPISAMRVDPPRRPSNDGAAKLSERFRASDVNCGPFPDLESGAFRLRPWR